MQELQHLVSNIFCTIPFKHGTFVKQSGDGISSCSVMKTSRGLMKRHKTQVAFWREVFWYTTLYGTGLLPKLLGIDPAALVLLIECVERDDGAIADVVDISPFRALDRYGVHHNQEYDRHVIRAPHGRILIVDWQFATWADNPSFSLGFMPCETTCPWHGTTPCIAQSNDVYMATGKRCVLHIHETPVEFNNKRVAVVWKGTVRSNVKRGSHATGYMPGTHNDACDMYVDVTHPLVLGKSTFAIRKSRADLFVHGWVSDGSDISKETDALAGALASNGVNVKKIILEHISKPFDKEFGQLLIGDRPLTEASTHPNREYVLLRKDSLQRWWSTWYTFHKAFSLIGSHSSHAYDIVVIHRPDMVIPDNLDYRALDSDALTILMQQDPNNYSEERVGYHDWFMAGSPDIIREVSTIYDNLYDIFDQAKHPEERSSHPLLRKLCEEKCIRVHCLHYTNVQKLHFTDVSLSTPVLSSVQSQCRMNMGCINDERQAVVHDVLTVTVQGLFCWTIALNCIKYIPGVILVKFNDKTMQTVLADTVCPCVTFHVSTLENFNIKIFLMYIRAWVITPHTHLQQKDTCFLKIHSKRSKRTELVTFD